MVAGGGSGVAVEVGMGVVVAAEREMEREGESVRGVEVLESRVEREFEDARGVSGEVGGSEGGVVGMMGLTQSEMDGQGENLSAQRRCCWLRRS